MFEQRLANLNAEQRQAVETIEGPVMVVAGPGSGKTELLSLRVANILRETDVVPGNILCLTFTEAAAMNMRERLAGLIGQDAYKVVINTFHGFGKDIINEYRSYFYDGAAYDVADEVEKLAILQHLFEQLPFKHPLATSHPSKGFVFLKDLQQRIEDLKKGGVTATEYKQMLAANKQFLENATPHLGSFFEGRISKGMKEKLPELLQELSEIPTGAIPERFRSLKDMYLEGLYHCMEDEKTAALTKWKNDMLKKDEHGVLIPKDMLNQEKYEAMADMYQSYQEEMHRRGRFDFADMLLDTAQAIEQHKDLQLNLQERYQYILVDEFQDTSGVQMRLLDTLLNMEVTGGNPNIMVVGDDDQAIYKFQGAKLDNILGFHKKFANPTFITLVRNYRSTQEILDLARSAIVQGEERLELRVEDLSKELTASHPKREGIQGNIHYLEGKTIVHEFAEVEKHMRRLHEEGIPYSEMAVIAPKHRLLIDMAHYLEHNQIPVAYTQKHNVLEDHYIQELITMMTFVDSFGQNGHGEAQQLLPEILAYPFWGLTTLDIWKLSRSCYEEKKPWLEVMLAHEDERIGAIAQFFVELGMRNEHYKGEQVLDFLLGVHPVQISEEVAFQSPFYQYYFAEEKRSADPQTYMTFLSRLQTFVHALREHVTEEPMKIKDMLEYINVLQANGLSILDTSPFFGQQDAVRLVTAHSSKGLEFQAVFVICALDSYWVGKGRSAFLSLPANLPLLPEKEDRDDKLRLFYVALTRAMEHLFISSHHFDFKGSQQARVQFLPPVGKTEKEDKEVLHAEVQQQFDQKLLEQWLHIAPEEEETCAHFDDIIAPVLEKYRMSVTHLNTYIDLMYGGPKQFLEQDILRFPRSKDAKSSFGTAMHKAVQVLYLEGKKKGALPTVEFLLQAFDEALVREHLLKEDQERLQEYGHERLRIYYEQQHPSFCLDDLLERDFKEFKVSIEGVPITGVIDKMHIDKEASEIVVTDFKTGSAMGSWNGFKDSQKLKLWKYRNQLIFYKLLVEHSSTYGTYQVRKGIIEFLEHDTKGNICLLEHDISQEEVEHFIALLKGVYARIRAGRFEDRSNEEHTFKDVLAFMEELQEEGRNL